MRRSAIPHAHHARVGADSHIACAGGTFNSFKSRSGDGLLRGSATFNRPLWGEHFAETQGRPWPISALAANVTWNRPTVQMRLGLQNAYWPKWKCDSLSLAPGHAKEGHPLLPSSWASNVPTFRCITPTEVAAQKKYGHLRSQLDT